MPATAPIRRLWLIGCGKMAGAMLSRWIEGGVVAANAVDVVNRTDRDLPAGVRQGRELPDGPLPDAVMLGVKPQQLGDVTTRFGERLADVPLVLSILAGTRTASLATAFPGAAIVRVMPNLPVAIGKGVVALHGDVDHTSIDALMAPLGLVEWIVDEAQFDAVTALSGSGPAFLYRFVGALAAGGAALGLDPAQADRLARATMDGAAAQAAADPRSLHDMAEAVASPGGSTRKGLDVLDAGGALERLIAAMLAAARDRNAEMAAQAGG